MNYSKGNKIKRMRRKYLFLELLYILIGLMIYLLLVNLYVLFYSKKIDFLSFLYKTSFEVFLILFSLFLLCFMITTLFVSLKYKKYNKIFHQTYLNELFEEVKLNDIYYQFRNKTFNKVLFDELEEDLSIQHVKRLFSISDVSPTRHVELNQVEYIIDGIKNKGVIIIYKTDEFLDGFFQIRNSGKTKRTDYKNKSVLRFGFTRKNILSTFDVFSSLGSQTFKLDNDVFSSKLLEFKKFVRCDIVFTRCESTISILLNSFQFNLTSNLLKSYKEEIFDKKVDSLIRFHNLVDELINQALNLNA